MTYSHRNKIPTCHIMFFIDRHNYWELILLLRYMKFQNFNIKNGITLFLDLEQTIEMDRDERM